MVFGLVAPLGGGPPTPPNSLKRGGEVVSDTLHIGHLASMDLALSRAWLQTPRLEVKCSLLLVSVSIELFTDWKGKLYTETS